MSEIKIHIPVDEIPIEAKTRVTNTTDWDVPISSYKKPSGFLDDRHEIFYETWSPDHTTNKKLQEAFIPNLDYIITQNKVRPEFQTSAPVLFSKLLEIKGRLSNTEWIDAMKTLTITHEAAHRTQQIRFGDVKDQNESEALFLESVAFEAEAIATEFRTSNVPSATKADKLILWVATQFGDWITNGVDDQTFELKKALENLPKTFPYYIGMGPHTFSYLCLGMNDYGWIEDIMAGKGVPDSMIDKVVSTINHFILNTDEAVKELESERVGRLVDKKCMEYVQAQYDSTQEKFN